MRLVNIASQEDFLHALGQLHATEAAPLLLGATLIHGELRAEIVEVEAYGGTDDPGSHAFKRRTPKNATMYERHGLAYVYISYGCHMMLNVVAKPEGEGSAILIRAARPVTGHDQMWPRRVKASHDKHLLSGPGKLCQAMGIDKRLDGTDLFSPHSPLRIELPDHLVKPIITKRIGISVGHGEELEWRYVHPKHGGYASRR